MPWRYLEAEVFVCQPTEVTYSDGLFHVTDRYSENMVLRRCYSPHVFLASMRAANKALADWQADNHRSAPVAIGERRSGTDGK